MPKAPRSVPIWTAHGELTLDAQRRSAIENETLAQWRNRFREFKNRLLAKETPTKNEYDSLMRSFVDYAEREWSRQQVSTFNDGGTFVGVNYDDIRRGIEKLDGAAWSMCDNASIIELWLTSFWNENTQLNHRPWNLIGE